MLIFAKNGWILKLAKNSQILIFIILFCYFTKKVVSSASNGTYTMCIPLLVPQIHNSAFFQKLAKNQPNLLYPLIFRLWDCFFRIPVRFYMEMAFHLPLHWFYLATIRISVNLPKFAQILCWWRHSRWHVYFYTMGPLTSYIIWRHGRPWWRQWMGLTFFNSAFNLH